MGGRVQQEWGIRAVPAPVEVGSLGEIQWQFGDYIFDESRRCIRQDARSWALPPKEFELLRLLIQAQGGVVPRARLLDAIWDGDDVGEGALTKTLQKLRNRMGWPRGEIIRTACRVGYQICVEVRRIGPPARSAPMQQAESTELLERLDGVARSLVRLAGQLEEVRPPALRQVLAIAVECYRAGYLAESGLIFRAVRGSLCETHGEHFALTQLATFYLVECATRRGERLGVAHALLSTLRVEALEYLEPGGDWMRRLSGLRRFAA